MRQGGVVNVICFFRVWGAALRTLALAWILFVHFEQLVGVFGVAVTRAGGDMSTFKVRTGFRVALETEKSAVGPFVLCVRTDPRRTSNRNEGLVAFMPLLDSL